MVCFHFRIPDKSIKIKRRGKANNVSDFFMVKSFIKNLNYNENLKALATIEVKIIRMRVFVTPTPTYCPAEGPIF